jgi:hypothetical protein
MNIGAGNDYPSNALSNFAPHPFTFKYDGIEVQCASMEGLLQSFKFKNPEMQKHICTLVGRAAKFAGKEKNWKEKQILYWNSKEIKRSSKEYQDLLDAAFNALSTNEGFQKALLASGKSTFEHTIGRPNPRDTVLTRSEFCGRLTRIRERLNNGNK